MKLEQLEHKHFKELFEVIKLSEPIYDLDRNTSDRLFSQREGFVLINNNDKVIGHITLDNYTPRLDIMVHCGVIPEYQKRWLTKSIYRQVFDKVFIDLECVRASGYAIEGLNDLSFHERLGFRLEGISKMAFRHFDKYYNVRSYGMMNHERRW
jgi:RimJ/RimL family protein N-acetyltransferase